MTALALLCASIPLSAQRTSDDPKVVAYDALSALLLGDRATFLRRTLPTEHAGGIVGPAPSGDERARIEEHLERVRLSTQLPPLFEGEPVEDGKASAVRRDAGGSGA